MSASPALSTSSDSMPMRAEDVGSSASNAGGLAAMNGSSGVAPAAGGAAAPLFDAFSSGAIGLAMARAPAASGAPAFTLGVPMASQPPRQQSYQHPQFQPQPQSQPQPQPVAFQHFLPSRAQAQPQPQSQFHQAQYQRAIFANNGLGIGNDGMPADAPMAGPTPSAHLLPPSPPPPHQVDWVGALRAAAQAHARAREVWDPNETEEERQRRHNLAAAQAMQAAIQAGLFLDPMAFAGLQSAAAARLARDQTAQEAATATATGDGRDFFRPDRVVALSPQPGPAPAPVPPVAFSAASPVPPFHSGEPPALSPASAASVSFSSAERSSTPSIDDPKPPPGQTLLSLIEAYDWPAALRRLRTHPSEARVVGVQGRTALHVACERDAPADVVEAILCAYPAATTAVGTSRMNPLHITCSSQLASVDVVRVLVDGAPDGPAGAVTSQPDVDGDTPLHAACRCGAPIEVIEELLRYNPRVVHERDHEGLTPLLRLWVRSVVMLGSQDAIDAVRSREDLTGELGDAWAKTELMLRVAYMGPLTDEEGTVPSGEGYGAGIKDPSWSGAAAAVATVSTSSGASVPGAKSADNRRATIRNCSEESFSGGSASSKSAALRQRTFRVLHAASAIDCPRHVVRIAAALYPNQLTDADEVTDLIPLMIAAKAPLYADHDLSGDGYFDDDDEDGMYMEDVDSSGGSGGTRSRGSAQGVPSPHHDGNPTRHLPHSQGWSTESPPPASVALNAPCSPSVLEIVLDADRSAAQRTDPSGRLPLALALESGKTWDRDGVRELLDAFPDAIMIPDPKTGLYPFMTAACSVEANSANAEAEVRVCYTIYELLQANPELVRLGVPNSEPIPTASSVAAALASAAGMLGAVEPPAGKVMMSSSSLSPSAAYSPQYERKLPAKARKRRAPGI